MKTGTLIGPWGIPVVHSLETLVCVCLYVSGMCVSVCLRLQPLAVPPPILSPSVTLTRTHTLHQRTGADNAGQEGDTETEREADGSSFHACDASFGKSAAVFFI